MELIRTVTSQSAYHGSTVHVTGHSLGGMVAMSCAVRMPAVSGGHVFNAGAGKREVERLLVGAEYAVGSLV
jgi:alpha-beta hydrolase superfamily lysophospholipase